MYLFLIILTIIICLLLGFIVLIQNPKGGGLSSNFAGSSQLMGVQKTGDFLEKGTWALAISIMVLALVINVTVKGGVQKTQDQGLTKEQIQKMSKPATSAPQQQVPLVPTTAPAGTKKP
jgi:preprotein translocase subunit SecG